MGSILANELDDLSIAFDYEGEVTAQDAEEILSKVSALYRRALEAAESASTPQRAEALRLFAVNLEKAFYGFEPDFFQQNLLRIVDDVMVSSPQSATSPPESAAILLF